MGFRQNFHHALHVLKTGRTREVDLFAFNGQPFLQMAGIGADGRSVELTTWEMKKKWKAFAYVIAGARAFTERQPLLTLTTDDGRVLEGRSIIFGNGRRYGGPMKLFAEANNEDGLLDAVVFKHAAPSIIRESLLALVHGGFHSLRYGGFEYVRMTEGQVAAIATRPVNWMEIMRETPPCKSRAPANSKFSLRKDPHREEKSAPAHSPVPGKRVSRRPTRAGSARTYPEYGNSEEHGFPARRRISE